MPWGQSCIPVLTGSGIDRVFTFGEEQTTIACTIDMRVLIQDVSSVGLQMIGGCFCRRARQILSEKLLFLPFK